MVDQLASAESCRVCGALLNKDQFQVDGLCGQWAATSSSQASWDAQSSAQASAPFDVSPVLQEKIPPDPDNPPWGPITGVSIWLVSFAAVIVVPVIAVGAWLLIQWAWCAAPEFTVRETGAVAESPNVLLVQVISTIVAHAIRWPYAGRGNQVGSRRSGQLSVELGGRLSVLGSISAVSSWGSRCSRRSGHDSCLKPRARSPNC